MSYETILEQFNLAPIEMVSVGDIHTNQALQPRVIRLIPCKYMGRASSESEQHITRLGLALEAASSAQLEPVRVARITHPCSPLPLDGLYLVDGHHRLDAYKRSHREQIPARILTIDVDTAVLLSKLANCADRSLAMHPEQCRDAAWQYLAAITERGKHPLPKGESLRSIAGRFGISKNTVSSMLACLSNVRPTEFNALAIDLGTGWPRWRYVREASEHWDTCLAKSPEQQQERDAKKLATQLIRMVCSSTPAIRERALEMLANDEVHASQQLDCVDFLAQISGFQSSAVPTGTTSVPLQQVHLDN